MRRALGLVLAAAVAALLLPRLRPAAKALLVLLDLYVGRAPAPAPRLSEGRETHAGTGMRVTRWRPARGRRHHAILVVNGAVEDGNDNPGTRRICGALARAGYIVVLPQFPALRALRIDPDLALQIDAAFAALRAADEARGRRVGAFGFSIGGGLLLAAAGRGEALRAADYLAVLGAHFDFDRYVAWVVTGRPRADVREKLARALRAAAKSARQREAVDAVLAAPDPATALARLASLPPRLRERLDAASPARSWASLRAPVFWLHSPDDDVVPVAEARAAAASPREAAMTLLVPRLLHHATLVSAEAERAGPIFWAVELARLLRFAVAVLRAAG